MIGGFAPAYAALIQATVLLMLSVTADAAGLKTQIDQPTLALGEALTVTLSGSGLGQIDLAPLAADFQVQGRTLSRSGAAETLVLTLYPLHEGRVVLPAMAAGHQRSRATPVTVTAGSAATPRVRFRVETDPTAVILRQPTRLTLEACDDGSLDWKRPTLPAHPALFLRPLGEEQTTLERDGGRCTAHRWYWSLIPTRAGPLHLTPPLLEAGKFGRQLRFAAPEVAFAVAEVPAWLPLDVAIGRPRVSVEKPPANWPVDRPLARGFEVVGGYSEEGLQALLALQAHPALNRYPPTLERLAGEERNSPLARLRVTFYADTAQTGPLHLPDLRLPWYDPASGRLESLVIPGGTVEIVNPALATLRHWLGMAGAGGLLAGLLVYARRRLAWRWRKRRGLAGVAAASDLATLSRAVCGFSLGPRRQPAPTLGLWRERLAAEARCEGLAALAALLERGRYALAPGDFQALRKEALRVLGDCRPHA